MPKLDLRSPQSILAVRCGSIPSFCRYPRPRMADYQGATTRSARRHLEVEVARVLVRALALYSYVARLLSDGNCVDKEACSYFG